MSHTVAPIALTMGEPSGIGGEITIKAWKNYKPTRMEVGFMSMATTSTGALSNSHSIFLQTVIGQGSEEQAMHFGMKTLSFEICGSYAQTELGHGSNVRGLQTTATYDKSTQEFILEPEYTETLPKSVYPDQIQYLLYFHFLI